METPVSLPKSPTLTLAPLAANRRNARKSTGPRTARGKPPMIKLERTSYRGKPQSRMNSLQMGLYLYLIQKLMYAPPCQIGFVAGEIRCHEQAAYPFFDGTEELFRGAEIEVVRQSRWLTAMVEAHRKRDVTKTTSEARTPMKIKGGEKCQNPNCPYLS